MDAIKLLKDDHKKVKDLFRKFECAQSADSKLEIANEAMNELEVHTEIEEEIFYPAYRAKANADGKEIVAEAHEEHHVVDVLIEELKQIGKVDETFEAKFTVLIENVEHHIKEEESEMLPDAKKVLGDDVDTLGEQMEQRKQELMVAAR